MNFMRAIARSTQPIGDFLARPVQIVIQIHKDIDEQRLTATCRMSAGPGKLGKHLDDFSLRISFVVSLFRRSHRHAQSVSRIGSPSKTPLQFLGPHKAAPPYGIGQPMKGPDLQRRTAKIIALKHDARSLR
jgi:hypothetical protein